MVSASHLVRLLREELQLLQEQGSYVGEVVWAMDKKKVLVKVHPEGKFVVDVDKNIDINDVSAAREMGGGGQLSPHHFLNLHPLPR